ncbi:MAG TPA: hypothetical protein VLT79_06690 [Gemmatimonadales bacterium]|nr:hypothetical protein [Gemmatimonadales bacterium]
MNGNDWAPRYRAYRLTSWSRVAILLLAVACSDAGTLASPTDVAVQIAFTTQPRTVSAGVAINPAIQVTFEDANGKPISSEHSVVTLSFGTNPSGATLSGTTSVAAVSGVATFSNVSIGKSGSGYALVAQATGFNGVRSVAFDILGGVAAKLAFTQQPGDAVVGEINPVQVAVQDPAGNTADGFNGTVTIAIGSNPGRGSLTGTATMTAVAGIATFSNLRIDSIGTGYTLTATATGLPAGVTSTPFTIRKALGRLTFTTQPGGVAATTAFSPAIVVAVQDTLGNVLANATNTVTLAIGTNPTGGTIAGTVSVAAVNGIATFGNVKLNRKGSGYTLTAATSGFISATSAPFNIAAGPAARLAFTTQPSATNAAATITPPVQVVALDAQGDTATGSTAAVTLAIGTNPGSGTLAGTTTQNAVGGVATFADLSIQQAGTGYTLVAGSAGLSSATSFSFNIAPVAPALHITTTTTGTNLPSSYGVTVDCDYYYGYYCLYDSPIGVNSAATVPVGYPGSYTIELSVPPNCLVSGDNPRTVSAVGMTEVPFSISCGATGSVHVTVTTTGTDIDPDGYRFCVDGPASSCYWSATSHSNDVVTFSNVPAGSHTVGVSGVADNCSASGGTTRAVVVPANGTGNVSFAVTCALAERIAFSSSGMIAVIHSDGSGVQTLTSGFAPAWSPDGSRLAYECAGDICAINGDGTGFSVLTMDGAGNRHPTWSSDGTKIAFSSTRTGSPELWVMAANGSGLVQLTQGVGFTGNPAWSPDGTRIVFDCQVDAGNDDLCLVNADGTGFARLTTSPAREYGAAWKPDGSMLAFTTARSDTSALALMSPTGGGMTIIGGGIPGSSPTWSSDGTRLAFVIVDLYGRHAIYTAHADGSNLTNLVQGDQPAWKPHH